MNVDCLHKDHWSFFLDKLQDSFLLLAAKTSHQGANLYLFNIYILCEHYRPRKLENMFQSLK